MFFELPLVALFDLEGDHVAFLFELAFHFVALLLPALLDQVHVSLHFADYLFVFVRFSCRFLFERISQITLQISQLLLAFSLAFPNSVFQVRFVSFQILAVLLQIFVLHFDFSDLFIFGDDFLFGGLDFFFEMSNFLVVPVSIVFFLALLLIDELLPFGIDVVQLSDVLLAHLAVGIFKVEVFLFELLVLKREIVELIFELKLVFDDLANVHELVLVKTLVVTHLIDDLVRFY